MKDYSIWLKGGGSIAGTFDRDNTKYPKIPRIIKIRDKDGYLTVRGNQVAGIGIYDHTDDSKVRGFHA